MGSCHYFTRVHLPGFNEPVVLKLDAGEPSTIGGSRVDSQFKRKFVHHPRHGSVAKDYRLSKILVRMNEFISNPDQILIHLRIERNTGLHPCVNKKKTAGLMAIAKGLEKIHMKRRHLGRAHTR